MVVTSNGNEKIFVAVLLHHSFSYCIVYNNGLENVSVVLVNVTLHFIVVSSYFT